MSSTCVHVLSLASKLSASHPKRRKDLTNKRVKTRRFERTTRAKKFVDAGPPDPAGGGFAASDRSNFFFPPTNARRETANTNRQPRRVGHHLLHCLESTVAVDSIALVSSVSDAPLGRRSVEKRYPSISIRKRPENTSCAGFSFSGIFLCHRLN